jgi:hypothetical protein
MKTSNYLLHLAFFFISAATCFPLNILKNRATQPMGHVSWPFLPKSRTSTIIIKAARKRVNAAEPQMKEAT